MGQNHPKRILCIDDEPVVRHILERAFSPRYDVCLLSSSETLTETLLSFQPNMMVLDIRMPDENGWMICSRLRRDKRFDSTPILFLSALGDEISVKKGYLSGGDFFLPKPFDIKELLGVVESLIGRKHHYPDENARAEERPAADDGDLEFPPPRQEPRVRRKPGSAGRVGCGADEAFRSLPRIRELDKRL